MKPEVLPTGIDLRCCDAVTSIVDVSLLPKAIGGDAVSTRDDGTEDEYCARGVRWKPLSVFLAGLSGGAHSKDV